MKQSREKIKQALSKASDIILDAIASTDGDKVIIYFCKQKGLSRPQTAQVSAEVTQVMLGLTRPEDFVGSIVERTKVTEDVAKAIAQEINDKIFRPIRDELKKVHGISTLETIRTTNTSPTPPVFATQKSTNLSTTPIHQELVTQKNNFDLDSHLHGNDKEREESVLVPKPNNNLTPLSSSRMPSIGVASNFGDRGSSVSGLDSRLRGNDRGEKGNDMMPVPKPPIVPFSAPKTEGLPNLMKKPPAIVIPTKPVAREIRDVKPMVDWQKAQPPEPPNPYRTMREDASKAFMDKSRPAPFIKNVDEPDLNREDLLNSMENPEHSEVKNYSAPATPAKNPSTSDELSVLRSKLAGMTNVAKTEVKFIPTQGDPYREPAE